MTTNTTVINDNEIIDQIIEDATAEETTEQQFNFEPITNFKADLKGAERLFWKGVKLINRFANITVNQWDKQDCISAIYVAVVTYEPSETDTPLAPVGQQYFGIETREQFRAGYNAVQKIIYQNRQQASKHEYDQDFGNKQAQDDYAEIELDLTLQRIMTQQFNDLLDYKLQGYSVQEIADITGIPKRTVERNQKEIKEILKSTFNVDTEGRKITKIQRKK